MRSWLFSSPPPGCKLSVVVDTKTIELDVYYRLLIALKCIYLLAIYIATNLGAEF